MLIEESALVRPDGAAPPPVAGSWPPEPASSRMHSQVGPPVVLARLDLTTFDEPSVRSSTEPFVEPPGQLNAVASRSAPGCTTASGTPSIRGLSRRLGDIGVGTARSSQRGRRVGPAGGLSRPSDGGADGFTFKVVDAAG